MNNVAALRTPQVKPQTRDALNSLWLRLKQAHAVAECIGGKCEVNNANEDVDCAIAQIDALAGTMVLVLATALDEVASLETMV